MKYIDANIFAYAIEHHNRYGDSCTAILRDILEGRIRAACSPIVPIELIGVLQRINMENKKQSRPELKIEDNIEAILDMPFTWLEIDLPIVIRASRNKTHLFGIDRTHLASMELNDITEIITADKDFDNIPGIKRIDPLNYKR